MHLAAHCCGPVTKAEDLLGSITLAQFLAGEAQVMAILRKRIKLALASVPDWVIEEYEAGNALRAANYLRNATSMAWSDKELAAVKRVHLSLLYMGAAADNRRSAAIWRNPDPERARLVTAAISLFLSSEDEIIGAMSDAVYRTGTEALMTEPVRKDDPDLIPIDFGYRPTMDRPPWASAVDAATDRGITSSTLAANLTTSRLVNYGALDSMVRAGITKYRIKAKLDDRTSETCRRLNGRVFDVTEGKSLLERALTSPRGAGLKQIHPWVRAREAGQLEDMTVDALRAKGYIVPPFHPHCRTVVVRAASAAKPLPYSPPLNDAMQATRVAEDALGSLPEQLAPPVTEVARAGLTPAILDDFAQAVRTSPAGAADSPALRAAAERRFPEADFDTAAKELAYRSKDKGLRYGKPGNLSFARKDMPENEREWMILMDADGNPRGAPNPGTGDKTGLSVVQQGHVTAAARSAPRSLEVHHNHPAMLRGRKIIYGLSPQDYKFTIANKGVRLIYAHIDENISFRMAWNPVVDEDWFRAAFPKIQDRLWNEKDSAFVQIARAFLSEVKDSGLDGHDLQALAQIAYGKVLRDELGMDIDFWGPELRQHLIRNYRAYQVMELHMTRIVREVLAETPGVPVFKYEEGLMIDLDEQRTVLPEQVQRKATAQELKDFGLAAALAL